MTKKFNELLSTEEGKLPFLVEEKDRYVFKRHFKKIL